MPNDQSFLESPWVQLGAPLAAMGLSIADRTRSGRISHAAGMGAHAVSGYGDSLRKQRLSQLKLDKEEEEDSEFRKSYLALGKSESGASDGPSLAGGDEPGSGTEAHENARTEALESGAVPSPTFSFGPGQQQEIEQIHKFQGRKPASHRLSQMTQEHYKSKEPKPDHYFPTITNEHGDQVASVADSETGAIRQHYLGGSQPKQDASVSEFEAFMNPATRSQAVEFNKMKNPPSQSQPSNQFHFDQSGKPWGYNPKTNTMTAVNMPGERRLNETLADFSDVESGSGSTAPVAARPAGKSPTVPQGGTVPPVKDAGPKFGKGASYDKQIEIRSRAFDRLPIVQSVQVQAQAVALSENMDENTDNPAADMGLIYSFAKAMDPDSAVREGEYLTVQKYSQSWVERFGFNAQRVVANKEFLTPEARRNLKAIIRTKYEAGLRQYQNTRSQYAKQIDRQTGGTDGGEYLVDYEGGFPKPVNAEPQEDQLLSKSGRPMKKNASGQWIYAD